MINMYDMYLSLNKANKINTRFIRGQSFLQHVLPEKILCTTQKVDHHIIIKKAFLFTVQKGENAKMEMKSGLDIGPQCKDQNRY